MNSNSHSFIQVQVQVRVQQKNFFEFKFKFGKMIEFFRVQVRVRSPEPGSPKIENKVVKGDITDCEETFFMETQMGNG